MSILPVLPQLPQLTQTDPTSLVTWANQFAIALTRQAQLVQRSIANAYAASVPYSGIDRGSTVGTTNGSGQLAVTFNLIVGKPLFQLAPVVVVSNGDSTAGGTDIVSVVQASVTKSGFTAQFSNPSSSTAGVARRVNWIAVGT